MSYKYVEDLKVVRADIVINKLDMNAIKDFFCGKCLGFYLKPIKIEFNEFTLIISIGIEANNIKLLLQLMKDKSIVEKSFVLLKDYNSLFQTFGVQYEDTVIVFELRPEDMTKNKEYYIKRKQAIEEMNVKYIRNVIDYSSFSDKCEFIKCLYACLYMEEYLDYLKSKNCYEDIEVLKSKLEYFGYDKDYYEHNYKIAYNLMHDALNSGIIINEEIILTYLIISLLDYLYYDTEIKYDKQVLSELYDLFFNNLEEKGYFLV